MRFTDFFIRRPVFAIVLSLLLLVFGLRALDDPRLFALSTRGCTRHDLPAYRRGDAFLLGPETRGLPRDVLESLPPEQRLRLPMRKNSRSLNLSNAAAVTVYEAWRQLDFDDGA